MSKIVSVVAVAIGNNNKKEIKANVIYYSVKVRHLDVSKRHNHNHVD